MRETVRKPVPSPVPSPARLFSQEKFWPTATPCQADQPRHARLFELIRQENLAPSGPHGYLQKSRLVSAQDQFRTMACNSLRRA